MRTSNAKPTVMAFAVQPAQLGNRKDREAGSHSSDLMRYISNAAGNAYEMCCKTSPEPMNALKADEEPR